MGCLGSLEDGGGSDDAGPNGSDGSSGEGGPSESGVVMLIGDGGGGTDRGASVDSGPVSGDRDDDGVTDGDDNCPDHANATQQDADGDGVGDACDEGELPGDRDHDGIPDLEDICPDEPDIDAQTDQDSDGFAPCTGDCDDGDRARSPGSQERCDDVDDDCDGLEDQGFDFDSDPANCGRCEVVCEVGQICRFGSCEVGQGTAITPNIGYGHHGSCDLWNSCRTGEGCATLACRNQGFAVAVDWVEGMCSEIRLDGLTCSLFSNNSPLNPENWIPPAGGCDLPVAYRVRCER